jgi:hypothetical protein
MKCLVCQSRYAGGNTSRRINKHLDFSFLIFHYFSFVIASAHRLESGLVRLARRGTSRGPQRGSPAGVVVCPI